MTYDYNSSRKKLILPEYGRNIQKMVNHIKTIEDRDERNKAAKTVIGVMGNLNPHLRDVNDFKHKLWDHLAIIADFDLDIDTPYEWPEPESLQSKPEKVPYHQHRIKKKHYGRSIVLMIDKAVALEAGEEKDDLVKMIAYHMKKSYLFQAVYWLRIRISNFLKPRTSLPKTVPFRRKKEGAERSTSSNPDPWGNSSSKEATASKERLLRRGRKMKHCKFCVLACLLPVN